MECINNNINNITETEFSLKLNELALDLNNKEKSKDFDSCVNIIDKICDSISEFLEKNKQNFDMSNINYYITLSNSFRDKKLTYKNYFYILEKTNLIKQKMTEKYLGNKKNKIKKDLDENSTDKTSNTEEFELILINNPISLLKSIIDICAGVLKFYEIQTSSFEYLIKNQNIKEVQNFESFFIYDDNISLSKDQQLIEKYIKEIKNIKNECERILDIDYDETSIKNIEEQILIIKEEFQKIYPKYINLKEILEKNNLIKKKIKN